MVSINISILISRLIYLAIIIRVHTYYQRPRYKMNEDSSEYGKKVCIYVVRVVLCVCVHGFAIQA